MFDAASGIGAAPAEGSVFGEAVIRGADGGRDVAKTFFSGVAVVVDSGAALGSVAKRPNNRSLGLKSVMSDKFDATNN